MTTERDHPLQQRIERIIHDACMTDLDVDEATQAVLAETGSESARSARTTERDAQLTKQRHHPEHAEDRRAQTTPEKDAAYRVALDKTGALWEQLGRDIVNALTDTGHLHAPIADHKGPAEPGDTIVILRKQGTENGDAQVERIAEVIHEATCECAGGEWQDADQEDFCGAARAVFDALRADAEPGEPNIRPTRRRRGSTGLQGR